MQGDLYKLQTWNVQVYVHKYVRVYCMQTIA